LEEQAQTLADTVAQFRLDSDIRPPASPTRQSNLSVVRAKPATVRMATIRPTLPSKSDDDEWEEF